MEDSCWYKFHSFIQSRIRICSDGETIFTNEIDIKDFAGYAHEFASRFIGECNRNRLISRGSEYYYVELESYKRKLENAFENEFGYKISRTFQLPENLLDYYSETTDAFKFHIFYTQAIHTKWDVYKYVFKELEQIINQRRKKAREHIKAEKGVFNLNLTLDQLDEWLDLFIEYNLLPKATSKEDFRAVFSGKNNRFSLVWQQDAYSLKLFLKKLNNEGFLGRQITRGYWEISTKIFMPMKPINGKKFYEKNTLMKASASKKHYEDLINPIFDRLKTLLEENKE